MRDTRGIEGRVSLGRDGLARAPRDEDRLGGVARHGGDLARDLLGELTLEGGIDHRDAVHVGIVNDHLERAVDEGSVVEDGSGHVDGVEQGAKARHEFAQLRGGFRRQRRHPHPAADALVGHEDARPAGDGDDGKAVAFGQPPAAESASVIDHVLNVLDLDDAGLSESRLVERHRAAEIGRVRGRGFLPLLGVADLPHENGLPRGHCLLAHFDQAPRILESLDVADDDFSLRVLHVVIHEIDGGNPDFIPGRDHLPEWQPAFQGGEVHHREPKAAALRDHADRPRVVVSIEHRPETGVDLVGNVDHALAVRPDDANVVLARDRHELLLQRYTLATHLGKTGAEDDDVGHALLPALAQHVGDARGVHQDEREIGNVRHVRERGVAAQARHFLIARIHGVELPLVAMALEKPERLAADGIEILRGADDGNRARIEKAFEVGSHP